MKRVVSGLVGFLLLLPFPFAGTAEGGVHLSLRGGYGMPLDPIHRNAAAFGGAIGFDLSPRLTLAVTAGYWRTLTEGSMDGLSRGRVSSAPLELSLEARFPAGGRFDITAEAGAGYALYSFSLDPPLLDGWRDAGFALVESVDHGLAAHLALGLEWSLGPDMALDIGARYHLLRTRGTWAMVDQASGETQGGTIDRLNLDALTLTVGMKIFFH